MTTSDNGTSGDGPRSSQPEQSEEKWKTAAFALSLLVAVLTLCAFTFWINLATNDEAMLVRVQITGAFVTLGLAGITFCTVVWRGMISARQADLQQQQIERLTRQIAATEENNLALMLQKGGELLGSDKEASIAAGIATLKAVATDANGKYAVEAMDLLADALQLHGENSHAGNVAAATISALAAGADRGRQSNRFLRFSTTLVKQVNIRAPWRTVEGIRYCLYEGGSITLGEKYIGSRTSYTFRNMRIGTYRLTNPIDSISLTANKCIINNFHFEQMSGSTLRSNNFKSCCFSGCKFLLVDDFPDLRAGDNWYNPKNPPTIIGLPKDSLPPNWGDVLNQKTESDLEAEIPF